MPKDGRPYKITEELIDLSTMAMEYFKDHLEPTMPQYAAFSNGNSSKLYILEYIHLLLTLILNISFILQNSIEYKVELFIWKCNKTTIKQIRSIEFNAIATTKQYGIAKRHTQN